MLAPIAPMLAAAVFSGQIEFRDARDYSIATLSERLRIDAHAATTNSSPLEQYVWVTPFMDRLRQVLTIPANWAGPGSRPPSMATLWEATKFLASIARPQTKVPNVAPTPDGGVNLTWYAGGVELEISVDPDGSTTASVFDVEKGVEYDELGPSDQKLIWAIDRLTPAA